ncbi:MAG: hypothetical protein A2Z91_05370 [Deltaproteobacteria bacterium GWA2_38_16]|nr:MAG: hypothetical protein A2Z91_05370 [Deltaproteobacteria bacterium GWA2_38_16]OGQ03208.1 MAG: hypothetical protein A3D19_04100 [Deltaproteobacteria bacterium RIFCSPHIGHO2_02_FULL_38_15]OGQ34657.1 MAG: hypothetical protein A3A72_00790 [Deltaproteobacteria bacterium RIFCSPLOWO2_01_FULL_38_9]OGQ59801.1 MAG: hypothetical protein A3G92_02815 [Deltaproteobacteria bacterium RIFCSPLOWO2_12_FULL_38_8]HBQ20366.1 hypothetical protein [Deltaproteobacteria bacterium]
MTIELLIEFSLWLELLALSLEAGLDFTSSLKELTKLTSTSLLHPTFMLMLSHLELGKPKQEVLKTIQKQFPHPLIETFCQTLLFGWQQGIGISPLLKEQASHIRTVTYFQLEKNIQKNQLKLLLPLFLLILPAVILVILTPLMIELIGNI